MGKITSRNDLLKHFIKIHAPTIFDVGANQGQTSLELLELFPEAILYIFEPDTDLTEGIERVIPPSRGRIFPVALSNKKEARLLNRFSNKEANSFYDIDMAGYYHKVGVVKLNSETVQCSTLDLIVELNPQVKKIEFLKIDTQGHSLEVLQGAATSLSRGLIKMIQVEVNVRGFYQKNESFGEILCFLKERDYELYTILHGDSSQIGHFFYDFATGEIRGFDAFFLRKDLL